MKNPEVDSGYSNAVVIIFGNILNVFNTSANQSSSTVREKLSLLPQIISRDEKSTGVSAFQWLKRSKDNMENGEKMTPQTKPQPETNSNASSSTKSTTKERKAQQCKRCYYHGVTINLIDHKRYCRYRNCKCYKCGLVIKGRKISALQVALDRAIKQDINKIKRSGEVDPQPLASKALPILQAIKNQEDICDSGKGDLPVSNLTNDSHSDVVGSSRVSTSYCGITNNHLPQMQVNPTSPSPLPSRSLVASCDSSRGDSPISDLNSDVSGTTSVSTLYSGLSNNHVPHIQSVNRTSPGPELPRKRRLLSNCDSGREDSLIGDLNSDLHSDVSGTTRVSASYPGITSNHVPQMQAVPDSSEYSEILLQYSTKLMEFFNFRCPTMLVPMFCILKYAGGNLEEAMKSIVQANKDICKINLMKAVRMLPSGRPYCCPGVYTALPTEAPTYMGQVPWMGLAPTYESPVPQIRVAPPSNLFYQWPGYYGHSHPMGTHTPATSISPSPESIPEDSTEQPRYRDGACW
ncbi:uncharacterized protein LOC143422656 [Xylocopa sonorina]|uniref:uncharacterized protein LOC143422656 n=1 Tax=Xylocopa sonorina TaxID=1818115 RepID=UPI00403B2279